MINHQKKFRLGIYEKAMPASLDWEARLQKAKEAGFDFVEISIDESDERRARLDWSDQEIYRIRDLCTARDAAPVYVPKRSSKISLRIDGRGHS